MIHRSRKSIRSPSLPDLACADSSDDAGPGWYASTWDLQQGLDVREGLPTDAAPLEELTAFLLVNAPSTGTPAETPWPLSPRRRRLPGL